MSTKKTPSVRFISPQEAFALIAQGGILVDVRTANELQAVAYEVEHLRHLPYADLKQRFDTLPTDRPLVFGCKSGKRSLRAAAYVSFKGYAEVYNLEGGILAWEAAGCPVVRARGEVCGMGGCSI